MKYTVLLGRILYSLIFLKSGLFHFSGMAVGYASSQGVPLASFLVPF
jgi:putative oxidoreductase